MKKKVKVYKSGRWISHIKKNGKTYYPKRSLTKKARKKAKSKTRYKGKTYYRGFVKN